MTEVRLISPISPPCVAMRNRRPSIARALMFLGRYDAPMMSNITSTPADVTPHARLLNLLISPLPAFYCKQLILSKMSLRSLLSTFSTRFSFSAFHKIFFLVIDSNVGPQLKAFLQLFVASCVGNSKVQKYKQRQVLLNANADCIHIMTAHVDEAITSKST